MYIPIPRVMKGQVKLTFILIALLILVNAPTPPTAYADTLAVTTFADELNTNSQCSLREAITNANNDDQSGSTDCDPGNGDDVINLPAGTYTLTLSGVDEDNNATGDLDIDSNITLAGLGATTTIIDGNAIDRVLHIHSSTVNLVDIAIQNGDSTGGVDNNAQRGGGIFNEGGTAVTLDRCNVINNTGRGGGGIHNATGTMTVNNSAIAGNTATANSGGIHNQAALIINTSTISGNAATDTAPQPPPVNGTGGGISTGNNSALTITITINNSTIANNSAAGDGGGIYHAVGAVTIQNSIVADNTSGGTGPDCDGTLNSQDYNLVENITGCTIGGTTTNNITGSDPQLSALANNGGETLTHALGGTSPALEQIPNGTNGCVSGTSTDQRGGVRADGANRGGTACEIGAFEFASNETPTAVHFRGFSAADNGDGFVFLMTAVLMLLSSAFLLKRKA